jgi:ATP-dependent protease ClpP protease subunit
MSDSTYIINDPDIDEKVLIYFNDNVDDKSAVKLITDISNSKNNNYTINIYISSPGGSGRYGLTIADYIEECNKAGYEINTYNFGNCSSSAIAIFMAGKNRYMLDHSRFTFHEIACNISKQPFGEAVENMEIINRVQNDYFEYIKEKCYSVDHGMNIEEVINECYNGKTKTIYKNKAALYGIITSEEFKF